jgi:hypothetical protein
MFQLVRALSTMDLATRQAPVLVASFLIAAFFYKFGSFALEAAAFLVTWFVLDALVEGGRSALRRVRPRSAPET